MSEYIHSSLSHHPHPHPIAWEGHLRVNVFMERICCKRLRTQLIQKLTLTAVIVMEIYTEINMLDYNLETYLLYSRKRKKSKWYVWIYNDYLRIIYHQNGTLLVYYLIWKMKKESLWYIWIYNDYFWIIYKYTTSILFDMKVSIVINKYYSDSFL